MANFGKVTQYNLKQIGTLSTKCMITAEGCSTPLKGIFDIFYTLFIIENFANRALVTQKINKELKRVAICAKVLFLHYNELLNTIYLGVYHLILPVMSLVILSSIVVYIKSFKS
jgi:hypothetical protein